MEIYGQSIENLNGLSKIQVIEGDLIIGNFGSHNPLLNDLSGLDSLTTIGGSLWIGHNYGLTNIASLCNLISVGDNIWIEYNSTIIIVP